MRAHRHLDLGKFGTVRVPPYLVRGAGGWQARPPGKPSAWFPDGPSGDVFAAFKKGCAYLVTTGAPDIPQHLRRRERLDKQHLTGIVGVALVFKRRKGAHFRQVQLNITHPSPGGKSRTLYVGTDNNWQSRYEQKIDEARKIREQFERDWAHELRELSTESVDNSLGR